MRCTSAAASKMIHTLEDKKAFLLQQEENNCTYFQAEGEKEEKPEYDFRKTCGQVGEIDSAVRLLKHALSVFHTTTKLSSGQTIDEALVEMAQLNRKLARLDVMRRRKAKERMHGMSAGRHDVAEYQILNYDPLEVQKEYEKDMARVQEIQLALDKVNQTVEFEVDLDSLK